MRNVLAGLLTLGITCAARGEIRAGRFHAASLDQDVAYSVQLPPSYGSGDKRYPVVYVLHGLFESQAFWERRGLAAIVDALWAKGDLAELVIVAVDGGNSFFVNGRAGRYEDLVTKDIVAEIESRYRVADARAGRGLLGVSMGGYAALRLALTHSQAYAAVATHSAMLLTRLPTREDGAGAWHMAAFHGVFGDPIDPALWTANDPLALAERAPATGLPALSFDCGAQDRYGLFAGNQEFHKRLAARGVPHQFALAPGDHGYEFVQSRLPLSLGFLAKALAGRR